MKMHNKVLALSLSLLAIQNTIEAKGSKKRHKTSQSPISTASTASTPVSPATPTDTVTPTDSVSFSNGMEVDETSSPVRFGRLSEQTESVEGHVTPTFAEIVEHNLAGESSAPSATPVEHTPPVEELVEYHEQQIAHVAASAQQEAALSVRKETHTNKALSPREQRRPSPVDTSTNQGFTEEEEHYSPVLPAATEEAVHQEAPVVATQQTEQVSTQEVVISSESNESITPTAQPTPTQPTLTSTQRLWAKVKAMPNQMNQWTRRQARQHPIVSGVVGLGTAATLVYAGYQVFYAPNPVDYLELPDGQTLDALAIINVSRRNIPCHLGVFANGDFIVDNKSTFKAIAHTLEKQGPQSSVVFKLHKQQNLDLIITRSQADNALTLCLTVVTHGNTTPVEYENTKLATTIVVQENFEVSDEARHILKIIEGLSTGEITIATSVSQPAGAA